VSVPLPNHETSFDELSLVGPRDIVLGSGGKFNTTEGLGHLWGVRLGMNF
jgi:hypothetical protein